MVEERKSPWIEGYNLLLKDEHSSASYTIRGPDPIVERNPNNQGNYDFSEDSIAAYYNAVLYTITGNTSHAVTATNIINAWANTLEAITGHDAQLAASLYAYQLVNAAELIRYTYAEWNTTEITRFEKMIINILYPIVRNQSGTMFEANWGTGCIKMLMACGVFLDDEAMYEEGLTLYSNSTCASLNVTLNSFGQSGESGRDQQHTQLGLGHQAEACQIAWNQGSDIWGLLSNRVLSGYEYTAKYNLNYTVEYDSKFYRCDAYLVGGPWQNISDSGRGIFRPIYEIAYAHYSYLKNLSMPFTAQVIARTTPEGPNPTTAICDNASYGTLLFHLG